MARRYRHSKKNTTDSIWAYIIVGCVLMLWIYNRLSNQAFRLSVMVATILIGATMAALFYRNFKRLNHEKQKLRAFKAVDIQIMDP